MFFYVFLLGFFNLGALGTSWALTHPPAGGEIFGYTLYSVIYVGWNPSPDDFGGTIITYNVYRCTVIGAVDCQSDQDFTLLEYGIRFFVSSPNPGEDPSMLTDSTYYFADATARKWAVYYYKVIAVGEDMSASSLAEFPALAAGLFAHEPRVKSVFSSDGWSVMLTWDISASCEDQFCGNLVKYRLYHCFAGSSAPYNECLDSRDYYLIRDNISTVSESIYLVDEPAAKWHYKLTVDDGVEERPLEICPRLPASGPVILTEASASCNSRPFCLEGTIKYKESRQSLPKTLDVPGLVVLVYDSNGIYLLSANVNPDGKFKAYPGYYGMYVDSIQLFLQPYAGFGVLKPIGQDYVDLGTVALSPEAVTTADLEIIRIPYAGEQACRAIGDADYNAVAACCAINGSDFLKLRPEYNTCDAAVQNCKAKFTDCGGRNPCFVDGADFQVLKTFYNQTTCDD